MKNIASLSVDISKYGDRVIDNLIKAQNDTAKVIWEDVIANAPYDTGNYINSIKVSDTTYDGSVIKTSVYTDAIVMAESTGNTYNLGRLLEEGTSPHDIYPIHSSVLKWTDANGEMRFAKYVHHPGTIAQPHFIPALNKNIALYKSNIRKALKEAE